MSMTMLPFVPVSPICRSPLWGPEEAFSAGLIGTASPSGRVGAGHVEGVFDSAGFTFIPKLEVKSHCASSVLTAP